MHSVLNSVLVHMRQKLFQYNSIIPYNDMLIEFVCTGCIRTISTSRRCRFEWFCWHKYNISNSLCCDCFMFLGHALQTYVILVCWGSGGSVLHRWSRGACVFIYLYAYYSVAYFLHLFIGSSLVITEPLQINSFMGRFWILLMMLVFLSLYLYALLLPVFGLCFFGKLTKSFKRSLLGWRVIFRLYFTWSTMSLSVTNSYDLWSHLMEAAMLLHMHILCMSSTIIHVSVLLWTV